MSPARRLAALLVGGCAAVQAAPFAYITNQGSHDVSVIDLAQQKVIATVAVGRSPAGVVASSRAGRVFISNPDSRTISVIDMRTQALVDTLPAGGVGTEVALAVILILLLFIFVFERRR